MIENGREVRLLKRIARYELNFDSSWMTVSGLLMGVCFFAQAVYFLGINKLQDLGFFDLWLYLICPMGLEFLWLVSLRGTKIKVAGIYGLLGAAMLILFLVQACFYGGVWDIVSTALYVLIGGGALIFITFGVFPYKLIGMMAMVAILCVRFFVFDWSYYIEPGNWAGLVQEIPTLCMMLAVTCFFGGIDGIRLDK